MLKKLCIEAAQNHYCTVAAGSLYDATNLIDWQINLRRACESFKTPHMEVQVISRTSHAAIFLIGWSLVGTTSLAQTSLAYGRITAARQVQVEDKDARAAGTIVGGAIGVISGSGKSKSNKALRGLGGAAIGSSVAGSGTRQQAFEYTVLLDGSSTIRMVTDAAGMRIGDCVAVERGAFNNVRLVPEERCTAGTRPDSAEASEANACAQAKQRLLDAETDADFDRAERRMRALCN